MELFTTTKQCIANITGQINITNSDEEGFIEVDDDNRDVFFTVAKLPSDAKFDILYYSSNDKGKSSQKRLKTKTLPMISGEKGKIYWFFFILFDAILVVMTNTDSPSYSEEIPTLVVVFVAATITILVLVTMLIIANTMKRRISVKTDYSQEGMQIKNFQVISLLIEF